jgi:hypothetical protein
VGLKEQKRGEQPVGFQRIYPVSERFESGLGSLSVVICARKLPRFQCNFFHFIFDL